MAEAIWLHGSELKEAWWTFAPAALRRTYNRDMDARNSKPASTGESKSIAAFKTALAGLLHSISEPDVVEEMRSRLLSKLLKGELIAVGFPVMPSASLQAIQIPIALLQPRFVDWRQNAIKGGDYEFRDVRVGRPEKPTLAAPVEDAQAGEDRAKLATSKAAQRHRAILDAYGRLKEVGAFDGQNTRKAKHRTLTDEVCRAAPTLFVDKRGLGYANICKLLDQEPGF